ncbi:MAG: CDP-diacylglycerol--glycerol-3-phosphate 3-phosphatidyltransferase [Roseiflexaceae bacterium]
MSARSIPNLLGLFRIITTPLLVALILSARPGGYLGAVVLLLLMAASDIADGKIARRLQVVSPLGVFLDTISDKIFVAGALIAMVQGGLLSGWIALLIIVRDFAVSGLRSFAAAEGQVITARQWGKQKLVITVTALVWRLLAAAATPAAAPFTLAFDGLSGVAWLWAWLVNLWPIPMGLAVIWTIFSGVDYFWKAWSLLNNSWAPRFPHRVAAPKRFSFKKGLPRRITRKHEGTKTRRAEGRR